jgi:tagatose-1,6-bisphosphate aldolase
MDNSQIKQHIANLKKTIVYLESMIVDEEPPKQVNESWKYTLKRVSKLFKTNDISCIVPDLTRFCSKLKKIKPISEYTDDEIIQMKLENDTLSSLLQLQK